MQEVSSWLDAAVIACGQWPKGLLSNATLLTLGFGRLWIIRDTIHLTLLETQLVGPFFSQRNLGTCFYQSEDAAVS